MVASSPARAVASPRPLSVAVIGGGPGGMFFCHALETHRRELMRKVATPTAAATTSETTNGNNGTTNNSTQEKADAQALLDALPIVTCFERASGPGGVWRSERSFGDSTTTTTTTLDKTLGDATVVDEKKEQAPASLQNDIDDKQRQQRTTTNMYEALWTNGPKESIEFFDFPFTKYFKDGQLPVYLPRQPVLDYMMARCTQHCPNFFQTYMQFDTTVVSVKYLQDVSKFEVVTRSSLLSENQVASTTTSYYDKCIWSGGENGKPLMPKALVNLFEEGNFCGRVLHSSDTSNFEEDVKGKRILLIGGSYSAEDLALMAVKVGADKVYISTRQAATADQDGDAVSWTSAWPYDKVEVLEEQMPVAVTEGGTCIQLTKTEWSFPNKYLPVDGTIATELKDIETVIFCTGYLPNFEMLDEPLREAVKRDPKQTLDVPKDWKMTPNKLTGIMGEVEPGDVRWWNSFVTYPGVYRGMSIANPNMMFLLSDVSSPLCGIDVSAWLLLKFITGQREIPSAKEMWRQNEADALLELDNPVVRYRMDHNYFNAFEGHYEDSPESRDLMHELYQQAYEDHDDADDVIYYRFVARMMREADYPVDYGTYSHLSKEAETIIEYNKLSYYHRYSLHGSEPWRTFRDYTDGDKFRSIFTDTPSVSLKQRWLDIDANDSSILE